MLIKGLGRLQTTRRVSVTHKFQPIQCEEEEVAGPWSLEVRTTSRAVPVRRPRAGGGGGRTVGRRERAAARAADTTSLPEPQ